MSKRKHNIVVSYDIHDEKRLQKVAKLMKDYGERVLKSVFECTLSDAKFEELKYRVEKLIDPMEDSVRYYFICDKCIKEVTYSGLGMPFIEDHDFFIT